MEPTSQNQSLALHDFKRRTLIAALVVCVVSVLSGIAFLFWREYGDPLLQIPSDSAFRLVLQGTVGPIFFGLLLFPLSAIVLFVSAVIIFLALRRRNSYLSVLSFVILAIYWLWLVKLISEDVFD